MARSLAALLDGATERRPMLSGDSLSGSRLERLELGGRRMVFKQPHLEDDWIMRATGDLGTRQLPLWSTDLLDRLPAGIDHAVEAVAVVPVAPGRNELALLLHDVGEHLVPEGSEPIALTQHRRFLEHMAALHAAFWGFNDSVGLMPRSHHFTFLTPRMAALEASRGTPGVPAVVAAGWARLELAAPRTASLLQRLVDDPWPLVAALATTPSTLIHADWKLGNLGSHPDGRTILLDWDRTGEGPACLDVAWYLAVNCDRLPESKELAVDAYRAALEQQGVSTSGWWDRQLSLALLGAFLQLAWAKASGDVEEMRWWEERALGAQPLLSEDAGRAPRS